MISTDKKIKELEDAINNIELFITEIKGSKISLAKPLSVELRKLLYEGGRGNNLLGRIENELGIALKFPDRAKQLPPKTVYVGLDEYRNRMIFALKGRSVTRIELIKLVANQKGAHIDNQEDILHRQSQNIILPLGNPARDKIFLEQNVRYLVEIANTIVKVVKNQALTQ